MFDEKAVLVTSGSEFRDLTDAARDWGFMALATRLRVVNGSETILDTFLLCEAFPIKIELSLRYESIRQTIEPCRFFRDGWFGTACLTFSSLDIKEGQSYH